MPLVLTAMIVIWLVGFLDGFVGPESLVGQGLSGIGMNSNLKNGYVAYIFGWVVVLAVVFGIGILVEMGLKSTLSTMVDVVISRVPLVGKLYNTARQLVSMLDKSDNEDLRGMQAVFVIFGKENGAGILALMPTSDRFDINGVEHHGVYLPTSPIPMTGGIVFVPCEAVFPVDMSVDGLMSIYLSMGVTSPQFLRTTGKGFKKAESGEPKADA